MSDDITFCRSECNNKKCFRHPSNIKEPNIPHSFAYMKDTDDCPYRKEQSQPGDLISRSALKEIFLQDRCGDNFLPKHYVISIIDNAPTVELDEMTQDLIDKVNVNVGLAQPIKDQRPKGEWIPVSELPEKTGYYLVTRKGFSIKNHVKRAGYDASTKRWSEGSIIAWQPLPEPYKEDDAE